MDSGNTSGAGKNRQPLVSVIMNCYNGEKYLRQAVDSVFAQTYSNWEIIFWDNQSSDGSADIIRGYPDPRVKYIYAHEHTLLYEARNHALTKANGEFLAFLDVDDIWLPEKLEKQVAVFADPEVGIACGNYWVENERKRGRRKASHRTIPTGWVLNDLLKYYFVGLVTLMIRRRALNSLEYPFDPRYHIIGDLDAVIRLSIHWKLGCVQQPVAIYRLHDNNESAKYRGRHADELEQWTGEMEKLEAIMSCRNSHFIKSHFAYIKAVNFVLDGNKKAAYPLLRKLPWGRLKFRLFMALILPGFVVRHVKN